MTANISSIPQLRTELNSLCAADRSITKIQRQIDAKTHQVAQASFEEIDKMRQNLSDAKETFKQKIASFTGKIDPRNYQETTFLGALLLETQNIRWLPTKEYGTVKMYDSMRSERHDKGLEYLSRGIGKGYAPAYYYHGRYYYASRLNQKDLSWQTWDQHAKRDFEAVVTQNPKHVESLFELSLLQNTPYLSNPSAENGHAQAMIGWQKAAELASEALFGGFAAAELGWESCQKGDLKAAIKEFQTCVSACEQRHSTSNYHKYAQYQLFQLTKQREPLEKAADLGDPRAKFERAMLLFQEGKPDVAFRDLNALLTQATMYIGQKDSTPRSPFLAAQEQEEKQFIDKILTDLRLMVAMCHVSGWGTQKNPLEGLQVLVRDIGSSQDIESSQVAKQAFAAYPEKTLAVLLRSCLECEFEESLRKITYKLLCYLYVTFTTYHYEAGHYFFKRENWDKAQKHLEQVDTENAAYLLGIVYQKKKKDAEALACLEAKETLVARSLDQLIKIRRELQHSPDTASAENREKLIQYLSRKKATLPSCEHLHEAGLLCEEEGFRKGQDYFMQAAERGFGPSQLLLHFYQMIETHQPKIEDASSQIEQDVDGKNDI